MSSLTAVRYRPTSYQRGEDTRRRILETAIDVFATVGYEGAGTRMLAERAGVNLPAIQYYFGSKEGLYRAAIGHIAEQIDLRMAPVADRVRAALGRDGATPKELLGLLHEIVEAFVTLVVGGGQLESRRLLFARAELERAAALDPLHEIAMRQVVDPCRALIGRLLRRPDDDETTILKTMTLLGQVTVFCNQGCRRALGWTEFTEERMQAIRSVMREHIDAIFCAMPGATS
ncbi:MAG TPA: CerR family C-terminal domain-containing protein [Stellaceae bacterium]